MSSESPQPLPFERSKNRKKPVKKPPVTSVATPKEEPLSSAQRSQMVIPDVVSKRMAGRMAIFSGVPTALGVLTFIASYIVISHDWLKFPHAATVLVSMGWFGLGVLGLSYGVISTSWEEEIPGTKLGWQEFTTNFGRMTAAWRSARQKD